MKSRVLVNKEVASTFGEEAEYVKDRFIRLLDSFETSYPRLREWWHGDKQNPGLLNGQPTYRRSIEDGMICSYLKYVEDGQLTYLVYMVTYKATKHALPYDLMGEGRRAGGAYYRLGDIPPGSLFETRDGVKAVKSEYYYGNDAGAQCQCVLLTSGEYAHFKDKNDEQVRLLSPKEFT